jgi:hypothetical protein
LEICPAKNMAQILGAQKRAERLCSCPGGEQEDFASSF